MAPPEVTQRPFYPAQNILPRRATISYVVSRTLLIFEGQKLKYPMENNIIFVKYQAFLYRYSCYSPWQKIVYMKKLSLSFIHVDKPHFRSSVMEIMLQYAVYYRPFQIRFGKLRKSYLHEVTWSFFNQSRKSSSPQNFVNNSLVRPENSIILSFSSAIKLKNTHI